MLNSIKLFLYTVFGWGDNKEDGKQKEENMV